MVTKQVFAKLESRVACLEAGGLASAQIGWLQEQVNRLDSGRKSLSFAAFADSFAATRLRAIEKHLHEHVGSHVQVVSVDHLWKGAPGNRAMGPLSIVELASNAIRENVLTKLSGANATSLTDSTGKKVDVGRAKTALQLKRNASLKQASDVLKKDARAKGQTIEIVWRLEEVNGARSKVRGVKVGTVMACLQSENDMCGTFQAPFADVTL